MLHDRLGIVARPGAWRASPSQGYRRVRRGCGTTARRHTFHLVTVRDIPTRTLAVFLRRGIIPAGMTAPNVHRAMPGVSLLEVFFTDNMGLAVSRGPDWMPHERSVPALKAGLSILRLCDP